MSRFLEIAPSSESITVRGTVIDVTGISAKGVASLFARFPQLVEVVQGKQVSTELIFELGADVVAAIIAAGCGMPGVAEAEQIAADLSIESQIDLLAAIQRQTFPNGIGPFVDKLKGLGLMDEVEQPESSLNSSSSETPQSTGRDSIESATH